jgi:hypothetical protein
MVKVLITQTQIEKYTEHKNFLVKSTPTEIKDRENTYSDKMICKSVEEYASHDVPMQRSVSITLIEQNVDDEEFDLKAVIKALNGL